MKIILGRVQYSCCTNMYQFHHSFLRLHIKNPSNFCSPEHTTTFTSKTTKYRYIQDMFLKSAYVALYLNNITYYFISYIYTRVNKKIKAIFKLRGNQDREELSHCAVLTMPVEEFSHVQYSALPSVEWQQRGRKHGTSFARLHHRRRTWRSAVSLGRRSEICGNSPSYVGSVWTEHHVSTKGL